MMVSFLCWIRAWPVGRGCLVAVVLACAPAQVAGALEVRVDPERRAQNIFGFGSGAVFYSNHLLEGVPSKQRQDVYDWLWTDVDQNLLMFQTRNDIEKNNDNDDPFKLDRSKLNYKIVDKTARLLLEAKKRRGDDMVFIATLYSPPAWLKDNGKIKGGAFKVDDDKNYLEMAEFVYAYLDRLKTEHGIDVAYLTWANEPDWDHKQPGTKWRSSDLAKATALSGDHLRKLVKKTPGMVMPKIIAANTLSVRSANRYIKAIAESRYASAKKNTDVIGFHLYDVNVKPEHYTRLRAFGLPMWMTEWTGPRNMPKGTKNPVSHSLGQMVGRFEAIHGGSSVIMHFEFGHPNHYSAGIFLAPWKKPWERDTPYYVWQQMVNRTPQGDHAHLVQTRLEEQDKKWFNRIAAFTDTKTKQTTVHLVNPSKNDLKQVVLDLSGHRARSAQVYRTSEGEDHALLGPDAASIEGDRVTVSLPAGSFVTVVVDHR